VGWTVRIFGRVAQHRRRNNSTVAQFSGQRPQRRRRLRRPQQSFQRRALAALDALRKLNLLLVREHATARASRRNDGRGGGIIRDGNVGECLELYRLLG
jgi:hypothetical protein